MGEIKVPKDFAVGFGSEVEEQAKSFRELQLVLILAIVLVYTVMASQYESLRDPFIIIFSIPLAAIGVVASLMLTKTPFSMQAYIGVIMLAGIVVSNAILLVDYTNTLRHRDKMDLRKAIEVAGRHRLRPILDDVALHRPRPCADGDRYRRRRRAAGAAGTRRHRRAVDLDDDHAGVRAGDVYAVRGRLARNL
jgi:Cu/Ag efflux pump CusA